MTREQYQGCIFTATRQCYNLPLDCEKATLAPVVISLLVCRILYMGMTNLEWNYTLSVA